MDGLARRIARFRHAIRPRTFHGCKEFAGLHPPNFLAGIVFAL
jgi:hypothetical protein